MRSRAVATSWANWSAEGVWLNGNRVSDAQWPEAPPLAALHPQARRPPAAAVAWVQLVNLLLSGRSTRSEGRPLARSELELWVGTVQGSATADRAFLSGLSARGDGFGSPSTFVYTLSTAAPAEAALAFGLRGGLSTVTAGTASGLTAVVQAMARIEGGHARACLCGSMELGEDVVPGTGGLSLFLLESETVAPPGSPYLLEGRFGWEPGQAPSPEPEPEDPMLALSRSLDAAQRSASGPAQLLHHRSDPGYWATLRVTAPTRG